MEMRAHLTKMRIILQNSAPYTPRLVGIVRTRIAPQFHFSILLAKKGICVTHFDISQPMIDKAKILAEKEGGLDRITFVKGALEDLSAYADRTFDLVMSFDAPISYTYPKQEAVVRNLIRIAREKIMISVSSRLGSLPYLANPLQKHQFILDKNSKDDWIKWCLEL